jgi:hypothetical protein
MKAIVDHQVRLHRCDQSGNNCDGIRALAYTLAFCLLLLHPVLGRAQTPTPTPTPTPKQVLTLTPEYPTIAPGGSLKITASVKTGDLPELRWSLCLGETTDPENSADSCAGLNGYHLRQSGPSAFLTLDANASEPPIAPLVVVARGEDIQAAVPIKVISRRGGLIVVPVIGFEQAGASSAQSSQKFFFNFFVSRPLPVWGNKGFDPAKKVKKEKVKEEDDPCITDPLCAARVFGPRPRWWGDVRIATYPQQISSGVGEFATGFATQVAQIKVNQLAQAGEFNTGLDFRISSFPKIFPSIGDNSDERVMLSGIASFGAISPFSPLDVLQIFVNPDPTSAQGPAFYQKFPSSKGFQFTGFTTPDRDRFYWEYGAGVRLTTLYFDQAGNQALSPAMVSYSLGQNQLVSGGHSSGYVQKIEAFFPLSLGQRFAEKVTTLYLFGRADMRLSRPHQTTPFILQPADASISGFNPQVNIISNASNRDLYTIGVGVDAVKLIKAMIPQAPKTGTSSSN